MSIKYSSIGHCAFRVNNYEKAIDFYCNTLEFEKLFSMNNEKGEVWVTVLRVTKRQYIEIFPEKYLPHGLEHSYNHMCFMVDDIVSVARQLEAKGVTLYRGPSFIGKPLPGPYEPEPVLTGSLAFYIVDPEGNEIEFMQFTENSFEIKYDHE